MIIIVKHPIIISSLKELLLIRRYGVVSKAQFPIDITPLSIITLVRLFEEKA